MYIYTHIYVYICVYVYTYIYTCIHLCEYTHTHIHSCMQPATSRFYSHELMHELKVPSLVRQDTLYSHKRMYLLKTKTTLFTKNKSSSNPNTFAFAHTPQFVQLSCQERRRWKGE